MNLAHFKSKDRMKVSFGLILILMASFVAVSLLCSGSHRLVFGFGLIVFVVTSALGLWVHKSVGLPLGDAVFAAKRMAAGDVSEPIVVCASGELGELQHAIEEMSVRMFEIVAKVRSGTAAIATTSGFITTDNAALSSRTESQASSLEQTAASMEELTATVRQNAENTKQAYRLVATAEESAVRGGQVVHQVIETMGSITESSRRIVDIIGVIDGLAFQTNILALNAAVEAARAGEQGRGFAVVAAEVRSLAQRSASAAKEIKSLIGESVEKVNVGNRLVDTAGSAMSEIVSSVKRMTGIVSEISEASNEQSAGLEEINRAVIHIDGMTQQNAALVEEAARTAASLREQATLLTEVVSIFNLGAREFGNADETVALVRRGVDFVKEHGVKAFIEDVQKLNNSQFIDRDLYFSVYHSSAKCLANGANPRYVGVDGNTLKDVDGKFFVAEIISIAKRQSSGWVDYKHPHPLTKEIKPKSVYFEMVGDIVISCGYYKM
jgi:methyl-accepting chemotaxis protein